MKTLFSIVLCSIIFSACEPEKRETATKGHVAVLVDESIAPVIILQAKEFMHLYEKNGTTVSYSLVISDFAVSKFILDTVRMICTSRPLTPQEHVAAENTFGKYLEILVAYDAVIAVVHHKNPVEKITLEEIRKILNGNITRWEQLSHHRKASGSLKLVIQDSSDEQTYLRQRIIDGRTIIAGYRQTKSPLATLREVVGDPLALGFIGSSWLDSAKVPAKVLEVAASSTDADTTFKPPTETIGKFFSPHPANIYRNYYPMKRALYLYTRSIYGDVGSGFGTFVAAKEGQKLFLDHGLVPGTQPIKLKRPD